MIILCLDTHIYNEESIVIDLDNGDINLEKGMNRLIKFYMNELYRKIKGNIVMDYL